MTGTDSKRRFRTYLVGEGSLVIRCGDLLLSGGHSVLGVVSSDTRIKSWALALGIDVVPFGPEMAGFMREPFDYLFSVVNLKILPDSILELPRVSAINFHDGPLPRYAGLNVTTWALIHQEREHGVTWHEMTPRVDAGRIVKQRCFPVRPGESAFSLNTKCLQAGAESFAELVDELAEGRATWRTQSDEGRSYFGRHKRPDQAAFLVPTEPAEALHALVQALDFGPYANPVATAKLWLGHSGAIVRQSVLLPSASGMAPGTLVQIGTDSLTIATQSFDLRLLGLHDLDGQALDLASALKANGLGPGERLPAPDTAESERHAAEWQLAARHETFWLERLEARHTLKVAELVPARTGFAQRKAANRGRLPIPPVVDGKSPGGVQAAELAVLAFGALLVRLCGHDVSLGLNLDGALASGASLLAPSVPLNLGPATTQSVGAYFLEGLKTLELQRGAGRMHRDMSLRYPRLSGAPVGGAYEVSVQFVDDLAQACLQPGSAMTLSVARCGRDYRMLFRAGCVDEGQADFLRAHYEDFVPALFSNLDRPLASVSVLSSEEAGARLERSASKVELSGPATIHEAFREQARRTPQAIALVTGNESLTYGALDESSDRLARALRRLGVRPGSLCGIYVNRSNTMVAALLGILKAGGAYVPLDPKYPGDRIQYMVRDAQLSVLVTEEGLRDQVPDFDGVVMVAEAALRGPEGDPAEVALGAEGADASDLAYVIYTSGSTGNPKGVMVEHRNVLNFFLGMDGRVPHPNGGTWLAVTSLSFDISVLEIFWTLARGFKVVIYRGGDDGEPKQTGLDRRLDFGLFYFASDAGEHKEEKYRLLLEGAKFGDRNGFSSVWTPERHFHAFGGLYPNPAVASAALSTITERIKIRSGSVVLPLHHPVRVAEDWALVDNLSNGRVGVSFAAGWQPRDFVLRPQTYERRREVLFEDMQTVRRLWRGETITFQDGRGEDVPVQILPRPIQAELPVWVTIAGNPDSFRDAGVAGANVLTHLLGQSVEEVAEKIEIYRQAWRASGHQGEGIVSLMLHALVGPDDEHVKEIVREPMKAYLRSAVDLVKKAAWSFPTFKKRSDASGMDPSEYFEKNELTSEEMDALLDHAFERYFRTSGLFGSVDTCFDRVREVAEIGVDEIACLIDFGVPTEKVMDALPQLLALKQHSDRSVRDNEVRESVPELIRRHQVSHLQCTPSMANMILLGEGGVDALQGLSGLLVGGEALSVELAKKLVSAAPGPIVNMYGPTETTIWSSTWPVGGLDAAEPRVSIGHPIVNTGFFVVDRHLQPVPTGMPGELLIGGEGVVRGYWGRPELTDARFVKNCITEIGGRLYRTGDLVRLLPDGTLEFLGRMDHQVKIRGHRIELGEIESTLDRHADIEQSVVVARGDTTGGQVLAAYYVGKRRLEVQALRAYTRQCLPAFMVPSLWSQLEKLPLTPNAKIDRKALPSPQAHKGHSPRAPEGTLEAQIAAVWQKVLNVAAVGRDDNFFDLGGHSLLTVQVHRELGALADKELSIVDIFRLPTVRSLAAFMGGQKTPQEGGQQNRERAAQRRQSLAKRRRMRPR